jgi:hypothetical protein
MYMIPILFNNVGYKFDVSDLIYTSYTSMCHMNMFLLQDKLKPFFKHMANQLCLAYGVFFLERKIVMKMSIVPLIF